MISKSNVGVILLLFFVVLLSQAKFFNFLLNTALGRVFLIAIILALSHMHKILGVVFVFIVIIILSNSDFNYLEGMTTSTTADKGASAATKASSQPATESQSSTSTPAVVTPAAHAAHDVAAEKPKKQNSSVEGFDMLGKERTLQKGHSSNTIPISEHMRESSNVAPYERSAYASSFSSF